MKDEKDRHTLWITPEARDMVESHYHGDNCSTKNEYIEKAVRFYAGYLDAKGADQYLPRVLSEVLNSKLDALGSRIGRLLFKLAVEQESSMLGHYDAGFTLRTYTHATRQMQDQAAETMGSFMSQMM